MFDNLKKAFWCRLCHRGGCYYKMHKIEGKCPAYFRDKEMKD